MPHFQLRQCAQDCVAEPDPPLWRSNAASRKGHKNKTAYERAIFDLHEGRTRRRAAARYARWIRPSISSRLPVWISAIRFPITPRRTSNALVPVQWPV